MVRLPLSLLILSLLSGCIIPTPWGGSDNKEARRELERSERAAEARERQLSYSEWKAAPQDSNSTAADESPAAERPAADEETPADATPAVVNDPVVTAPEPATDAQVGTAQRNPSAERAQQPRPAPQHETMVARTGDTGVRDTKPMPKDSPRNHVAQSPSPEPDLPVADEPTRDVEPEADSLVLTVPEPKPSGSDKLARARFVGWWYGNQPTSSGGRVEWIRDSREDGMFLDRIRLHQPDGSVQELKEIGQWGVVSDTSFTIVKSRTVDGDQQPADQDDLRNYSAYTILGLDEDEIRLQSKSTGDVYVMERVEPGFTFEEAQAATASVDAGSE